MFRSLKRAGLAAGVVLALAPAGEAQLAATGSGEGGFGGGGIPVGTLLSAAINPEGWSATLTFKGLGAGGTYTLTPDTAPKLVFSMSRPCYDSSQTQTTCPYTVVARLPKRNATSNSSASPGNQEAISGGNLQTIVALSEYVHPTDTAVSVTALAGAYTDSGSNASRAGSVSVANNSTFAEGYPIGNWITPAGQRWSNGGSFTVEFAAFDKFPRNFGQAKAVKFIASDGTHAVSRVATAMALSQLSPKATCATTQGSAVLSCPSTLHFFPGSRVTVIPSTKTPAALALGGEPFIAAISSNSSLTLRQFSATATTTSGSTALSVTALATTATPSGASTSIPIGSLYIGAFVAGSMGDIPAGTKIAACPAAGCGTIGTYTLSAAATASNAGETITDVAGASDTVTVVEGNPIYDYQATFTSGDQATLNAGPITVEAIVYRNYGANTLDSAHPYAAAFSTTCTATSGSPTLTACGSVGSLRQYDHVTLTGFAGDTYLWADPSGTTLTLATNAPSSGTVTVAAGLAATTITPNLKSLAVYNDYNATAGGSSYGNACAWVVSGGTASGTAGVFAGGSTNCGSSATAPATASAYASPYAAATALATWNATASANGGVDGHPVTGFTRSNACGNTIFIGSAVTGNGGAMSTAVPTGCGALTVVAGAPALVAANTEPVINCQALAGQVYWGLSVLFTGVAFVDSSGNPVCTRGSDTTGTSGNGPTARVTHHVYEYVSATTTLTSSCGPFFYAIGWVEHVASLFNEANCIASMTTPYSVGGGYSLIGNTHYGKSGSALPYYTAIGNIQGGTIYGAPGGTAYTIPSSGPIIAFERGLAGPTNASTISFSPGLVSGGNAYPYVFDNFAVVQSVFEMLGTSSTTPAARISGDYTTVPNRNELLQAITVVGARLNHHYNDVGAYPTSKTGWEAWVVVLNYNTKTDNFGDPKDGYLTSGQTPMITGATGCTGDGSLAFAAPTSNSVPATLPLRGGGTGVTQTGHIVWSGTSPSLSATGILLDMDAYDATWYNGLGYAGAVTPTYTGDSTCASVTIGSYAYTTGGGRGSSNRIGNFAHVHGVGHLGNVAYCTGQNSCASVATPAYNSWLGTDFGMTGNTTGAVGYSVSSYAYVNPAQNSNTADGRGMNTGYGDYSYATVAGVESRVPAGYAPFPGGLNGRAFLNDGTDCAGAFGACH